MPVLQCTAFGLPPRFTTLRHRRDFHVSRYRGQTACHPGGPALPGTIPMPAAPGFPNALGTAGGHDPLGAVYGHAGQPGDQGPVRKYRSAADYAHADPAVLEAEVQSTGFYRNKAKNLKACCQAIEEQFGGEVPRDLDALVKLPGIGRKTANVVLGTAYGIASGVVVDTHVGRLSRRWDPVRRQGRRADRAGPDAGDSAEGLDRLQPPHDSSRPPDLHREESPTATPARWLLSARRIGLSEERS